LELVIVGIVRRRVWQPERRLILLSEEVRKQRGLYDKINLKITDNLPLNI
jgi:hypothetical protein